MAEKRTDAETSELLFVNAEGNAVNRFGLAALFREHLKQVGLHEERPELFQTSDARVPIRVHDLRSTFITVALANGRTESWICDRTGHRSSQMIARYKRVARHFAELNLGDFTPLDEAIPEFRQQNRQASKGPARRRPPRMGQKRKRKDVSSATLGT